MKKALPLLFFLSLISSLAAGQNFDFGKVSQQELDMKKYDKDTSAHAVVLNEYGKAQIIEAGSNELRLMYEYHVKIKVFDHRGFRNGTVEIRLRNNEDNSVADNVDNISGITTFKDNDGAIKSIELDPKTIYKTKDYKYQSTLKFAMPGLVDGCVIEYRYILTSPFFFDHFHSWEFQSEIPKEYSEYDAAIPGFWHYNIALRGPLKLVKDHSEVENDCFSVRSSKSDCLVLSYAMKDVPAFVSEEYMTTPKNYLAALNFDLVEATSPYTGLKKSYTTDWKDVDYQLKENGSFGVQLKKKDWIKDHIPANILSIPDTARKAKLIYKWVQNNLKWNNYTGVYSTDGIKNALEKHNGSLADINIILVDALNAAGIYTEAVLLSTRDHGFINKLYPVTGDFNYVIAKANFGGSSYFLDATDALLPFGVLPEKCLNDQGRVFSLDKPSYWINMDTGQKKMSTYNIVLTLQDDGKLKGTLSHISSGYDAYLKRKAIKKFNSLDDYYDSLSGRLRDVKISKSDIANLDSLDNPIDEEYTIEYSPKNTLDPDRLDLNPYLFDQLKNNPFKLTERTYPVDMGMPIENRFIITVHLPAQYTIENNYQAQAITLPNNGGRYITEFNYADNTVTFSSIIQFNKASYQVDEYPYLKEFYNKIILAEKADIQLKKKL